MKLGEEVRLWGVVDPDYVAAPGQSTCPFVRCNLFEGHEGPHLNAHPCSGRIFGLWDNEEDVYTPEQVSQEAVKIVMELNALRDEAIEAIEAVMDYRDEAMSDYANTTDSQVEMLLSSDSIWPASQHQIEYCGSEMTQEEEIRKELLDILGLNPEEDF